MHDHKISEAQYVEALAYEVSHRSVRSTKVSVIDYAPSSTEPESQLAPTGTIAVYVGRKSSPLLKEVAAAVRGTRSGADRKLARKLMRRFRSQPPLAAADAFRKLASQPVLGNLSYGGSTMAHYLFADGDDDLSVTLLAYTGGDLIDGGFRFDEFLHEDDDEPLQCILVRNTPKLTPAELAALKKVPPDLQHVYVSPLDMRATGLLIALAAHALVWAFVVGTFVISGSQHGLDRISPERIDALGPVAAARAMLRLRMDVLQGNVPNLNQQIVAGKAGF